MSETERLLQGPNGVRLRQSIAQLGGMTDAELARAVADKLDHCVVPEENRRVARLMLLHLSRVLDDPHFAEEARLLIGLLRG